MEQTLELMVLQSRNFLHFMEPESSLQCSKHLPLVPVLSQINPVHTLFLSYFVRSIQCGLFLSGFLTKVSYAFLFSPHVLPVPSPPVWLPEYYLVMTENHETPLYAVLFSFLLLHPSLLGPNSFLDILFSNSLIVCSSFNVKDQLSHPYKTAVTTV